MKNVKTYQEFITEKKWSADASKHVHKGKMHDLLGIPEGEKVSDHYDSAEGLIKALKSKVKNDAKVARMINFAANINSGSEKIFKDAEAILHKKKEKKDKSDKK